MEQLDIITMHPNNNSLWVCRMFEAMINIVVRTDTTRIEVEIMIGMDTKGEGHTKDTTVVEGDSMTGKRNPIIHIIDTVTKEDLVAAVMVDFILLGLRYL